MKKSLVKRILIGGIIAIIAAGGIGWYLFAAKFSDTTGEKATYTVNAVDFIHEFEKIDSLPGTNKKYAEQIISVSGKVSAVEAADSTINVKMSDTATGAYIIFAFQQQDMTKAKAIKEGDSVSIKGSCSGGAYSDILETVFISFKRCAINN